MSETVNTIEVTEGIKLGQFLKFAMNLDSGGQARELITEGSVLVNNILETRRGASLSQADLVEIHLPDGQIVKFSVQTVSSK